MRRNSSHILSILLIVILCFALVPSSLAFAEEEITADTPMPDMAAIQQDIDEANAAYDDANRRILEIEKEIESTEKRIQKIQNELPSARQVSDSAAREYYVMLSNNNTFLEILLGATSMEDFFAKMEYTSRMNQSFLSDITKLSTMEAELEEELAALEFKKKEIQEEQLRAEEALADAENAMVIAEDTALKIAEATALANAELAAQLEAENHEHETPYTPGVEAPEMPAEKQEYVDLWTPRIDAYLAGSPLAGYGYAFANAAFDYGVDPRWSPAISFVESSRGLYCFRQCNAWGWGNVSWPDWETAIYAHVRGLSIGYGFTISEAAAKKYCPPNWQHWYTGVSNQMNLI